MHPFLDRRAFLQTALAAGLPLSAAAAGPLLVNTYGGRWEKYWRNDLLPGFTRQTGVATTLDISAGGALASRLRAAGQANPYSVVMMTEVATSRLRPEGLFEAIPAAKVPNMANVYPNMRTPGDMGVRGIVSTIGLGYRTDLVKTPPKRWADLWSNPEFAGKIGLYKSANTAALLFVLLIARLKAGAEENFDVAFSEIKKLMPFAQVDWSGTLATLLTRGEVNVAMIDFPEIIALKQKGVPVEMVVPQEGVVAFEQTFSVLKTAPDKPAAYRYINYILEPQIQEKMAREFYTSPTTTNATVPQELQRDVPVNGAKMGSILQFDWDKIGAHAPTLLDRWNREMR